jgi:hypothetical protein
MKSSPSPEQSRYRVEKSRTEALVTLANGETIRGFFFVSATGPRTSGPERVLDLLNAEAGFFPFERHDERGARTVMYNRAQVVLVALADDEASRDAGYDLATSWRVTIGMTSGRRVDGTIRVYRPEGRNRLSDWARQPAPFQYLETDDVTLIVNVAHVIDISETI